MIPGSMVTGFDNPVDMEPMQPAGLNVLNAMSVEVRSGRSVRCVKQRWMGEVKMLDSEKIDLIDQMLTDFWNNGSVGEDSAIVMLNAIATVINFKRKD